MEEVSLAELIPCSTMSRMFIDAERLELVALVDDQALVRLYHAVLDIAGDDFFIFPAARSMHHAVRHGLYQHSVEVARTAYRLALCPDKWKYRKVDTNLVVVGALIHDIGKVREYREKPSGDYGTSSIGAMLGHITLGMAMLKDAADACEYFDNEEQLNALMHIIASHHGRQEWGALVTPATDEALCVHLADMFSMQINVMNDLRDKAKPGSVCEKRADVRAIAG
jgi:3'-5' exoribonuclease